MNKKIQYMKKAGKATSEIMKNLIENFSKFKTEKEVKKYIKKEIKKRGMGFAFETMIISGKDSANPHHFGNKKLEKGFCVMDFGASYKGWKSDMTRTIYIGNPTKKDLEIYKKVEHAYKTLSKMPKINRKIEELCSKYKKMLGEERKHALGHGVGWRIHQKPRFGLKTKEKFEENKPYTIEPGYYVDGYGGVRIEDTFYINKKGEIKNITQYTTKLIIIKNKQK